MGADPPIRLRTDGCNLCGERAAVLVTGQLRHGVNRDVVRCAACGLVYLYPLFSPEEERQLYESEYRDIEDIEGHYLPKEARAFFEVELPANAERLRRVERYLRADGRALEIGSAAGSFLHLLRQRVEQVEGVELHRVYSAFAREQLALQVHDRPLEEIDFATKRFDYVFVWHTLEHLRDPVALLRTVRNLLRPAGLVFIELPNIDDILLTGYRLESFKAFYYQPAHSYYFSPKTLRLALERAGLIPQISMLQRYSLGNHLNWIRRGQPQARPMFRLRFPLSIPDAAYRSGLKVMGRSDTLLAIGRRPDEASGSI